MFRQVISRVYSHLLHRHYSDTAFVAAWKKVVPNIDPPKTPLAFISPHTQTSSSIPSKLTVNFVLPYSHHPSPKQVDIPGHVATIAELKPGVMSVHDGNEVKKYFISGGFAFLHPNSCADIIATESVSLNQIDPAMVQKGLAEFTQKLGSASTDSEKAEAQIGVDVHSTLNAALSG